MIEDKHSSENKTFSQTTVNNALKWREENQKDKKSPDDFILEMDKLKTIFRRSYILGTDRNKKVSDKLDITSLSRIGDLTYYSA